MSSQDRLGAKLVFYLEHKEEINEWLGLRKLEPAAADRFFKSLHEPLAARAGTLAGSPHVSPGTGKWGQFVLYRDTWKRLGSDKPLAGIGLCWQIEKRGTRFARGLHGVWVNRDEVGFEVLREGVVAALAPASLVAEWGGTEWWPVLKRIGPSNPKFWADLDGFADEIVDAVAEVWNATWELVDPVVSARHTEPGR